MASKPASEESRSGGGSWCGSVAEAAVSVARLGASAAVAGPLALVDQGRALIEGFDLRDPERGAAGSQLRVAAEMLADEALMAAFRLSIINHPPHIVDQIAAEVDQAVEVFDRRGWIAEPTSYFAKPPPLLDPLVELDRIGRLRIERITFDSEYEPHPAEPGRRRWESYGHNHTAHAWVLRHAHAERPWLVLHHGASMGWTLADFTVFRAAWLHHDLQLNLVFPVMPFHGPRAVRSPLTLQLPVDDPVDTLHAVAQSVWDSRRLLGWIRAQSDQPIAIQGLSLGTLPASLVAAVEPDLAALTVGVPVASLSDLYVRHMPSRLRRRPEMVEFVNESKRLLSVVSPLSVTPLVPRDRRFLYAASDDRVSDTADQAYHLWQHWDRPEVLWFRGAHLGVAWSGDVTSFVRHGLAMAGLLEEEHV